MGHRPLENQVSNTSGSCSKPAPGDSVEGTTSPSGPYHTGIRCPHQSCLETFQSRTFSSHLMVSRRQESGWTEISRFMSTSIAGSASGLMEHHHCSESHGSMTAPHLSQ